MDLVFDISQEELPIFLAETDDHLQVLDEGLVQLEREEQDPDLIQAMFRAAHTLKGMAGMIGHKRLVDLTHTLETGFDGIRKNQLIVTTPLIDVCLEAVDALRMLRMEVIDRKQSSVDVEALVAGIKQFIESARYDPTTAGTSIARTVAEAPVPATPAVQEIIAMQPNGCVNIQAIINPKSIASAARAFQVMMALQELGEIVSMDPPVDHIEAAKPVQTLAVLLQTTRPTKEINDALSDISEIDKVVINGQEINYAQTEAIVEPTSVKDSGPAPQPTQQSAIVHAQASGQAENKHEQTIEKTIRTSVERLDSLMNLVGELITDRNRLNQIRTILDANFRNNDQVGILSETITHIGRITDQLQEEVMRIRMVPIANVFSKFPRMVRDLAQKTNKDIDLAIFGQETEMDRSVIEQINDPLIHLIRNGIDHGIETPAERIAAGKSPRGTITLTARHEQGRIIITIEDDGKGINTDKLKQVAVQRGFLTEMEAAQLTPEKAIDLIFMSGVSTAKSVTDISGRGVGMDIVRNNIEKINGSILVESQPGKGSKFQIVLPLTLAIVPTLLVRVGQMVFAIPMVMVLETMKVYPKDIKTINGHPVTVLREHVLPLAKIGTLFNIQDKDRGASKDAYIVVVGSNKTQIGLMVDALIGEEEVVVKSMGGLIGEVAGIASAAILGDGQIALIVDIQGIFKLAGIH